jgi:ribose 5-phosphate isomerase B
MNPAHSTRGTDLAEKRYTIAIGCDHAAYPLKEEIKRHLTAGNRGLEDVGTHGSASVDYVEYGQKVAALVSRGVHQRGILLCGTGLGMSMVANRFPHVRAALCNDLYAAIMSRRHNDANILAMGGRVIGSELALSIVDTWLATPFEGGRHQLRLAKFDGLPEAIRP